jgi:hypothetical protein
MNAKIRYVMGVLPVMTFWLFDVIIKQTVPDAASLFLACCSCIGS